MRLTLVAVDNVLSMEHATVEPGDGLTVIVGPNGAGKTNMTRVVTLAGLALRWLEERSCTRTSTLTPYTGWPSHAFDSNHRLHTDGRRLQCAPEPCPRHRWRGTYRAAVTATMKSIIAWRAAGLNPRIARS